MLSAGHEPHARLGYCADMTDPDYASIRLIYMVNERPMDYMVRLVWTTLHNGGRRWWFLCPIRRDDGKDACSKGLCPELGAVELPYPMADQAKAPIAGDDLRLRETLPDPDQEVGEVPAAGVVAEFGFYPNGDVRFQVAGDGPGQEFATWFGRAIAGAVARSNRFIYPEPGQTVVLLLRCPVCLIQTSAVDVTEKNQSDVGRLIVYAVRHGREVGFATKPVSISRVCNCQVGADVESGAND